MMNPALVAIIQDALTAARNRAGNAACKTHSLSRIAELRADEAEAANALQCLAELVEAQKHCGYANYETFLVKLAIDNAKGTKVEALALARTHQGIALADALKDFVETWTLAGHGNSLRGDLTNAALGRVDWRELAQELEREVAEGVE